MGWAKVCADARAQGLKAHAGRIFGICVEKGSELPKGTPGRNYKGRVVFQGNNVRDEDNLGALFNDLGSSPATMAAGRFVDFYGERQQSGTSRRGESLYSGPAHGRYHVGAFAS